ALADGEHRLVVDARGWVRLPEPDRTRTGIATRAIVADAQTDAQGGEMLVLRAADTQPASAMATPLHDHTAPSDDGAQLVVTVAASRTIGERQILAPTTIDVRAGELHIVSGRSGSGKTTLLGLLAGFSKPDVGTVTRPDPPPPVA